MMTIKSLLSVVCLMLVLWSKFSQQATDKHPNINKIIADGDGINDRLELLSAVPATVSLAPRQVHISLGENPNQFCITWITWQSTSETSSVAYGLSPFELNTIQFANTTNFRAGINRRLNVHWTTLVDLKPSNVYYYTVGTRNHRSRVFTFQTQPNGFNWSPRVIVFGDLGVKNSVSLRPLLDEGLGNQTDVILHAGDIAYDLSTQRGKNADTYLSSLEPLISKIPYMVAPGNHEFTPVIGDNGDNYINRFKMPGGTNNMYYSFGMGPLRVVVISTELFKPLSGEPTMESNKMMEWLNRTLTEANQNRWQQPWIVVIAHKPMYCTAMTLLRCAGGQSKIRRVTGIEKLLYKHGVDIAFFGHNHHYERTFPVYDLKVLNGTTNLRNPYENPRATIYVVTGAAGNQEGLLSFSQYTKEWSALRLVEYSYTRLYVANRSHLLMQQYGSAPKRLIDEIWIIQENHGPFDKIYKLAKK